MDVWAEILDLRLQNTGENCQNLVGISLANPLLGASLTTWKGIIKNVHIPSRFILILDPIDIICIENCSL